ncbi:MAG TPA: hypothetical protein VJB15_02145, partial [Rhodothermia bacterium]|nr:hypothetical protein [Rhodothermia bacterium]
TQDASAVMEFFGAEKTELSSQTYDDGDFDELYKLTRSESNQSIRRRALELSMEVLSERPPAIFLYQTVQIHAIQRRVSEFSVLPNLIIDLDRASK